jgi:hypothetical protein
MKTPWLSKPSWLKQPAAWSTVLRGCLLVTLGADGLIALLLAGKQLDLNATLFGTLGAGILLGIAVANFWALGSTVFKKPQWPRQAFIAQLAMFLLASYAGVFDILESPRINKPVLAAAVVIATLALAWMIYLAVEAALPWTKTATVAAALLPLVPLLQFWLQNYYIPGTLEPQVDLSTELSEQGRTGTMIHLAAKVTIRNRSSMKINVAGEVIRVTAYPPSMPAPDPSLACDGPDYGKEQWCTILDPMDPSGLSEDIDYRLNNPARLADVQLVYAAALPVSGSYLTPGETDTLQRDVDIDSSKVGLARLSVSALVMTNQKIQDTRSCQISRASMYSQNRDFSLEVRVANTFWLETTVPAPNEHALGHYLCIDYALAPRSVIEWLMGNELVDRVVIDLDAPEDTGNEYPQLWSQYRSHDQSIRDLGQRAARKIEDAKPEARLDASTEYAVTDQPPSKNTP